MGKIGDPHANTRIIKVNSCYDIEFFNLIARVNFMNRSKLIRVFICKALAGLVSEEDEV